MCELADRLKLCSCDSETLSSPDWILERQDLSLHEQHRRGRAMMPRFDEGEQACIDAILDALAQGGAFDFDYSPAEGDVLRLHAQLVEDAAKRRNVRFRFLDGHWTHDRSTSLTGWRAQMAEDQRGMIAEP